MQFDEASEKIRRAKAAPETLFGGVVGAPSEMRRKLRVSYRELQLVVHPDHNDGSAKAHEATAALNALYGLAVRKIKAGTWGKDDGVAVAFKHGGNEFRLSHVKPFAAGDLCSLYTAELAGGSEVVLKVARRAADSDLLANEARVLRKLWADAMSGEDVVFSRYLPELVASVKIGGKAANVFKLKTGCHTLSDVIAAHPDGLDERHVAWMWRRLIELSTWVHRRGYIHGALLPQNVLVFPKDHRAVVLDWTAAVTTSQPVRVMVAEMEALYPPEMKNKVVTGAAFDIYMLGKLALALLYGSSGKPRSVHPLFLGPIRAATVASASMRYSDAVELYEAFDRNIRKLFGAPKFVEFTMP